MTKSIIASLAFLIVCISPVAGDDAAVGEHLESLGGKITVKDGSITEISFRDSSQLKDAEWKAISSLEKLQKVTTYGGARGLNDSTVGHLSSLRNLESLSVDGGQLSDVGLAKLAEIPSLKSVAFFHLSFRMEGFTGSGFAPWKKLNQLEKLTVAGMSMGDEGFAAISEITSLQELRTWHTHRTQASHAMIAKMENLKSLKLGQRLPHDKTPVCLNDESLATVAKIESLETLDISEADFSLEGLRQLRSMPNLKRLRISVTYLEEATIETLRSEMPGVQIDFDPIKEDQRKKLEGYLK